MSRPRRASLPAEAALRNRGQLAHLGSEVRDSRRRRHLTQAALGSRVGLSQSTISQLERGRGGTLSVDTWQRVFTAIGRRLELDAGGDPVGEPRDAGHLAIQELILRLGRAAGYSATFELATRPSEPLRSSDVGLRDDVRRRLVLVECWNTIGDVGAAARASNRKLAEARDHAIAIGGERPHAVSGCWVVRATAANRLLVGRYPEIFASRFPGSSVAWLRTLTTASMPPSEPGLIWSDLHATRLLAWRRRG